MPASRFRWLNSESLLRRPQAGPIGWKRHINLVSGATLDVRLALTHVARDDQHPPQRCDLQHYLPLA